MNTKHMFPVNQNSVEYFTHAVSQKTGEVFEVKGNKVEFPTSRLFRQSLAVKFPDNQIPQNQPLTIYQMEEDIQDEEVETMVAEGTLSEPKETIIEPIANTVVDPIIFDRPTEEEVNKATLNLESVTENIQFEEIKKDEQTVVVDDPKTTLNLKQMETTIQESTTQQEPQAQPSVPFTKKVQWYSAVGAGHALVAVTGPTHFVAQTLADSFQAVANGIAATEAYGIDKLCIAAESREEIKQAVAQRTRKYQSYVTAPIRAVNGLKNIAMMAAQADIHMEPATQS